MPPPAGDRGDLTSATSNGDAELVVCCDYRVAADHSGGTVKRQGAIDVPEIRAEITTVMEGGEQAFKLRKEKYGF